MRRWFTTLALIAVLFLGVLLSLSVLATAHSPKVVAVGLFFLLILGLGIFSVRAQKMTLTSKAGLRVLFAFLFKASAAVAPVLLVHWVSTHLVERLTLPLQARALASAGSCCSSSSPSSCPWSPPFGAIGCIVRKKARLKRRTPGKRMSPKRSRRSRKLCAKTGEIPTAA